MNKISSVTIRRMLLIRSHQPLEERLAEAGGSGLLAHDDGSELAVVADQDDLLGPQHDRNHALRFSCLKNDSMT